MITMHFVTVAAVLSVVGEVPQYASIIWVLAHV